MSGISDFSAAGMRFAPPDRELPARPVILQQAEGCHLVIFKTGHRRYPGQLFDHGRPQQDIGACEYDDPAVGAASLLQVRADQMAQARGDINKRR